MKATELARLLPLLVPALSEAKGWHGSGGWEPAARSMLACPPYPGGLPGRGAEVAELGLDIGSGATSSKKTQHKPQAGRWVTMKSTEGVMPSHPLTSHHIAPSPEIQGQFHHHSKLLSIHGELALLWFSIQPSKQTLRNMEYITLTETVRHREVKCFTAIGGNAREGTQAGWL